jgi:lipopolysaccharide export LptBFGC system permease protein LptF
MVSPVSAARSEGRFGSSLCQIRLWQLSLLVVLVALAIVDIQDHGRREPFLVTLAAVGYAAFGVLCWIVWHGLQRFRARLRPIPLFACYSVLMAAVFLAAVVVYLVTEHVYLGGKLV